MRLILALALLPLPSLAWEFSPDPICTLTHQDQNAEIMITYDVRIPEYALSTTLKDATWSDGPFFSMAYPNGPGPNISTDRHVLSSNGTTLTVRDSGFGNVLAGLERNQTLIMTSGDTEFAASLADAFAPVQAFRNCPAELPLGS